MIEGGLLSLGDPLAASRTRCAGKIFRGRRADHGRTFSNIPAGCWESSDRSWGSFNRTSAGFGWAWQDFGRASAGGRLDLGARGRFWQENRKLREDFEIFLADLGRAWAGFRQDLGGSGGTSVGYRQDLGAQGRSWEEIIDSRGGWWLGPVLARRERGAGPAEGAKAILISSEEF